jgi:hypothetical protein
MNSDTKDVIKKQGIFDWIGIIGGMAALLIILSSVIKMMVAGLLFYPFKSMLIFFSGIVIYVIVELINKKRIGKRSVFFSGLFGVVFYLGAIPTLVILLDNMTVIDLITGGSTDLKDIVLNIISNLPYIFLVHIFVGTVVGHKY